LEKRGSPKGEGKIEKGNFSKNREGFKLTQKLPQELIQKLLQKSSNGLRK
jgi:hypothetical protein